MKKTLLLPILRSRAARGLIALMLMTSLTFSTGCFGRFQLTRGLYKYNINASRNEFVQTVVFWGFMIIPAYESGFLVDLLILNPIEFWSGKVLGDPTRENSQVLPNGDLQIQVAGEHGGVMLLRPVDETTFTLLDSQGMAAGTIKRADNGDLLLYSTQGELLRRLPGISS